MKIVRFKDLKYTPASHENFTNPGVWKKILLHKNDLSSGLVQMINWAKLPIGNSFAHHYHEDMEEIFVIIKGKTKITIGEESAILQTGDTVVIPMGQVHAMKNIGKTVVYYLVVGISQGKGGKTINVIDKNPSGEIF